MRSTLAGAYHRHITTQPRLNEAGEHYITCLCGWATRAASAHAALMAARIHRTQEGA